MAAVTPNYIPRTHTRTHAPTYSHTTLLALIKGSPGSQQLPMGTIEFLLNILIGTSEPTLTNVVADVIEKVCPAFVCCTL